MRKFSIVWLALFFCLVFAGSACAKYADYNKIKTSDEIAKAIDEDVVYPDKAIYTSGTIQILLPCVDWLIESDAPDLKIWVWMYNVPNKGYWRPVAKGERVSKENSIAKISVGGDNSHLIEIYYLESPEMESANWRAFEIGIDDTNSFAEKKNKDEKSFKFLKGKNFSYEIVTGSENVITSLKSIAQYIISSLISDRELCGFIVTDARGFLIEVIEFDQEKVKKDSFYKKNILEKLDGIMVRDDQFFIAIYKSH